MWNVNLGNVRYFTVATDWSRISLRKRLNVGTVPTVKMHPVGTVPTVKMHPVGTVPTDKMHPVGTLNFSSSIF